MATIPSSIGRAQISETPSGLRIVVPAKWSWYTFIVDPLCGMFIFAVGYISGLLNSKVTVAFLVVLTIASVFRRWLWNIAGTEEVTITSNSLIVWYGIFGIGWPTHYRLKDISNFRYVNPVNVYRTQENRTVAFDCEFMPHRFGLYLSESDANCLIAAIQSRIAEPLAATHTPRKIGAEGPV